MKLPIREVMLLGFVLLVTAFPVARAVIPTWGLTDRELVPECDSAEQIAAVLDLALTHPAWEENRPPEGVLVNIQETAFENRTMDWQRLCTASIQTADSQAVFVGWDVSRHRTWGIPAGSMDACFEGYPAYNHAGLKNCRDYERGETR